MEIFLRSHCALSRTVLLSLVVISLLFITSYAEGAEPASNLFKALESSLHVTVSKQVDRSKDISMEPQKVYSEETISTPHVRVSLSDTMKLFLDRQPASKDYYDVRNNINGSCTMLGLDILF
jgi:hypothetical protein